MADVLPPARGKCSAADAVDFPSPALGEGPGESSGGAGGGGVCAHHAASRGLASSGPLRGMCVLQCSISFYDLVYDYPFVSDLVQIM